MTILSLPVDVPPARLTDAFGARESFSAGEYKTSLMHGGQDVAPPLPGQEGFDTHAPGVGRVVAVRRGGLTLNVWGNKPIYGDSAGNYVITEHVSPVSFLSAWGQSHTRVWVGQAHLATVAVKPGDTVTRDSFIGDIGETGAARGEHVHIDVFTDSPSLGTYAFNRRVDPMRVLSRDIKARAEAVEPVDNLEEIIMAFSEDEKDEVLRILRDLDSVVPAIRAEQVEEDGIAQNTLRHAAASRAASEAVRDALIGIPEGGRYTAMQHFRESLNAIRKHLGI